MISCLFFFQWLKIYTEKVADLGVFGDKMPNHVLVNEYLAGQGIMVKVTYVSHKQHISYGPTVQFICCLT
jgi:hypothetical protein